jgi:outer membrane lipoprotein-sorting protein
MAVHFLGLRGPILHWILSAAFLFSFGCAAPLAQSQTHIAPTLDNVLQDLDRSAHNFHSLTGDVERTKVTVVVNDKSTESGKIWIHDENMRLQMNSPNERTILRRGDHLYIFTPGLKRVEEYDLGKHRAMLDQFLLLGFGTSGKDLQKAYTVTLVGEETLDGRKTLLLELAPKSGQIRNQFSKIQLWLDESTWLSAQQKFFEAGSEDYFIIHYTNLVRNPKIDDSRFKAQWPNGTVKFTPPMQ